MSLARDRMPSETMRSTSRTTGRWLACSAETVISSGLSSASWTTSAVFSKPSSSTLMDFSGRYSSSSFSAIRAGSSTSARISRAVAKASAFSASKSKGFEVATSRNESVMRSGSTRKRRASCSGTFWATVGSSCPTLAILMRKRAARAARICSLVATFSFTIVSHSVLVGPICARSSARRSGVSNPSRECTSHSSEKTVSGMD